MKEDDFLIGLGARIKSIRVEKKFSQMDLAINCNFEKASLSRIESGKSNPTVLTLLKISNAMKVPVSHFFHDEIR